MALFRRLLSWIGFEVEEEIPDEIAASEEFPPRSRPQRRPPTSSERSMGGSIVPLGVGNPGALRVVILIPRDFEDVQVIADHLKERRPVIVNLEGVDRDLAQRVINFLSGTIYALAGEMHRIGAHVLFFAPGGIEVSVEGRVPKGNPEGTFGYPRE